MRFPSRGQDLREAVALPQVLPGPRVTATGPPHALLPRPPAQAGCGPGALGPTRRVPRSPAAGPTRGSGTLEAAAACGRAPAAARPPPLPASRPRSPLLGGVELQLLLALPLPGERHGGPGAQAAERPSRSRAAPPGGREPHAASAPRAPRRPDRAQRSILAWGLGRRGDSGPEEGRALTWGRGSRVLACPDQPLQTAHASACPEHPPPRPQGCERDGSFIMPCCSKFSDGNRQGFFPWSHP